MLRQDIRVCTHRESMDLEFGVGSRLSARDLLSRPVQQEQVQLFWNNLSCMLLLVYRFHVRI